jgi:hypothetical protein
MPWAIGGSARRLARRPRTPAGSGTTETYTGGYTLGVAGALADGDTALGLAGSGSVQVLSGPNVPWDSPISLEAWVQDTGGGFGTLASPSNYVLSLTGGRIGFSGIGVEGDVFNFTGTRIVSDGAWHHVVGTADPISFTAQLFVDGTLDASTTYTDNVRPPSGFYIGTGIGGPLTANVDEVAIYASVLTADRIAQHVALPVSPGGGSGRFTYTVAPNPSIEVRTGIVTVAGLDIPVTQAGRPCIDVAPETVSLASSGGSGALQVTARIAPVRGRRRSMCPGSRSTSTQGPEPAR